MVKEVVSDGDGEQHFIDNFDTIFQLLEGGLVASSFRLIPNIPLSVEWSRSQLLRCPHRHPKQIDPNSFVTALRFLNGDKLGSVDVEKYQDNLQDQLSPPL